ncbi:MAG: SUMF1/EgtB/PvdO family nonheme iron enzyme, partial [Spirochaetia bacterium]|nr:SUMF1/EgtB/PvdO family nonheme iron enzyme [Spirochaetia bacterium]
GKTALIIATEKGQIDIIELLINADSDISLKDNDNKTALEYASISGNAEIIKRLADAGADINAKNEDNKSALMILAENHDNLIEVVLYNQYGDSYGKVIEKYLHQIKEVINSGADVKAFMQKKENMERITSWLFVDIPDKDYLLGKTEVTEQLFNTVIKDGDITAKLLTERDYPVTKVNWYEAILFCNKLSIHWGLEPVYAVDGITDVSKWKWDYKDANSVFVHKDKEKAVLLGKITYNKNADGYRLPTREEWQYAAKSGEDKNSSSYSANKNKQIFTEEWTKADFSIGNFWGYEEYYDEIVPHKVSTKKANAYGVYDMLGNVKEWVWDETVTCPYCKDTVYKDEILDWLKEGVDYYVRKNAYNTGYGIYSDVIEIDDRPLSKKLKTLHTQYHGQGQACGMSVKNIQKIPQPEYTDVWFPFERSDFLGFRLAKNKE